MWCTTIHTQSFIDNDSNSHASRYKNYKLKWLKFFIAFTLLAMQIPSSFLPTWISIPVSRASKEATSLLVPWDPSLNVGNCWQKSKVQAHTSHLGSAGAFPQRKAQIHGTGPLEKAGVRVRAVGFERNEFSTGMEWISGMSVPFHMSSIQLPMLLLSSLQRARPTHYSMKEMPVRAQSAEVDAIVVCFCPSITKEVWALCDCWVSMIADRKLSASEEWASQKSAYCLMMCGDTPTSRTFPSSMVSGCTPLLVGTRLRLGDCRPPCFVGYQWPLANRSHLPYAHQINYYYVVFDLSWSEMSMSIDAKRTSQSPLTSYSEQQKQEVKQVKQAVCFCIWVGRHSRLD
jgi:hypothetical protein